MERTRPLDKITLDVISKAIAIFTSLLIFLGIVSSAVYYRAFSINILENITIGEALVLFISKFTPSSIALLFGVFVAHFFLASPKPTVRENEDESSPNQKITLRLWQKLYAIIVIMPLFILSIVGFSPLVLWTIPLSLAVRLYVLFYIIKRVRLFFRYKNLDSKVISYIQIACISIILIASIAMTEAYLVFGGNTGKVVKLHHSDGDIIRTDSTNIYLGKSQSYYYLYDKADKRAIILKADQIDRMDIEKE